MDQLPGCGFSRESAEFFLHTCLYPPGVFEQVEAAVADGLALGYALDLYHVPPIVTMGGLEWTLGERLLLRPDVWSEAEVRGMFEVWHAAVITSGLDLQRLQWEMTQDGFQPAFNIDDLLLLMMGKDSTENWVFEEFSDELYLLRGVLRLVAIQLWYPVPTSEHYRAQMVMHGQAAQILAALTRWRQNLPA